MDLSAMLHEAKDKLSELEARIGELRAENEGLRQRIAELMAVADAADVASRLASVEQMLRDQGWQEDGSSSPDDGSDTPPYAINGDGTAEMEDDGGEEEVD